MLKFPYGAVPILRKASYIMRPRHRRSQRRAISNITNVKIVAIVTHSRMILAAFYPKRRQSFQSFIWLMTWKAP